MCGSEPNCQKRPLRLELPFALGAQKSRRLVGFDVVCGTLGQVFQGNISESVDGPRYVASSGSSDNVSVDRLRTVTGIVRG